MRIVDEDVQPVVGEHSAQRVDERRERRHVGGVERQRPSAPAETLEDNEAQFLLVCPATPGSESAERLRLLDVIGPQAASTPPAASGT